MKKVLMIAAVASFACGNIVLAQQNVAPTSNYASGFASNNSGRMFDATLGLHTVTAKKRGRGDQAFAEGKSIVCVGYGFPNLGKSILNVNKSQTNFKISGFGPMHFKFEYGLSDKLGLGLDVNYVSYGATFNEDDYTYDSSGNITGTKTYSVKDAVSAWNALVTMTLHFATTDKLDPYWSIGVGYSSWGFKETTDDPNWLATSVKLAIPVGFGTTVGMRYYFTDNIGMYLAIGYEKAAVQAGLAAKF